MMNLNRTCIKCDSAFQLKPTDKATNICYECKKEYQRIYSKKVSKVALEGKKESYPIPDNERRARFVKMQKELSKMRKRSEWQAYIRDKLDNIDPKILKWIYDRRDQESKSEERDTMHKKESYEDTRTTHNNDKSWFD